MFCHDGSSLLCSSRKNSTIVSTRARNRWERPEAGERAGHCLHTDRRGGCRDRGKDGIHRPLVWGMGNSSDAFAGVPCLTPRGPHASPYRLSRHQMLAFSLSAVSAPASPEGCRAGIMRLSHSRRRTAEHSCLMRDTREMEARMVTSVSLPEQETGWS